MRHAALPFVTSPYSPVRSVRSDQRSENSNVSNNGDGGAQEKQHRQNRAMSIASDTDSELAIPKLSLTNPDGIACSPIMYRRDSFSNNLDRRDNDSENDQNTIHTFLTSITSTSTMQPPLPPSDRKKLIPKRIRKAASRVLRIVHATTRTKEVSDSGSDSVRAMTL